VDAALVTYLPPVRPSTIRRWSKALRTMRTSDVVYLNSVMSKGYAVLPVLALVLGRYRGKVVISPRGELATSAIQLGRPPLKQAWLWMMRILGLDRRLARACQRNVVWLASSQHECADVLVRFPQASVLISPERLRPKSREPAERDAPAGSHLRVISVARVAPVKGTADLVRALQYVRTSVDLTLVGTIDDAGYANEVRAAQALLPDHVSVTWAGSLPPDDVEQLLEDAQLSVLLTRGENFGHAIGESLQAGCPVLISDQTPWSWVADENAGVVLPEAACRDPQYVAAQIDTLAGLTCDQWAEMSTRARLCGERGVQIPGSVTLLEALDSLTSERVGLTRPRRGAGA
jgi:glycosyltransferase involved in cell wall biosynthesis